MRGPLISAVIARIAPQVDELLISANRHLDRYAVFGHAIVTDQVSDPVGDHPGFS
jgi:molybdopterin-guanine dinucleotide biosynthesis protein A